MPSVVDGPSSDRFMPLEGKGSVALSRLAAIGISAEMSTTLAYLDTVRTRAEDIAYSVCD